MAIGWGIDVGVGSIGLAVLELDDDGEPQRLIDGQARIFKAATGGAERRGHRSSRTDNWPISGKAYVAKVASTWAACFAFFQVGRFSAWNARAASSNVGLDILIREDFLRSIAG